MNYTEKIDPRTINVARVICSFYNKPSYGWNPVSITAALHLYCHQELEYHTRHYNKTNSRPFRNLQESLPQGGNCEEKSVTLASLLVPVKNVEIRFVSVSKTDAAHLLLEAKFPALDQITVQNQLTEFYKQSRQIHCTEYNYSRENEWLIADPEMSEYIGDVRSLESTGYAWTKNDDWNWTQPYSTMYEKI